MQPYLLFSITYSKHIKYIQIHLYITNMLMKSLFVHYIYILLHQMGSEDVSRNDTGETTLGETYKSRNVKLPMMFIFPRELSKYLGTESIFFLRRLDLL